MSDNELKDDWTALVAKEASVLRSGQAWADIFDDDDDDNEDTGVSNEANEQAEGSTTVVNKEHNKMPVDYLDDIDLTIPLPRPQTSVSTPTHLHSDNEFYHPSEDSDNWRVRETKSGAESDNWRKRDPHGVKPISFASFSDKDRFDDNHQQEERKEYRKPEKRRIDPEDAAALEKWNTFHLVVAQEELEKEKEKERLKNLYLESLKNGSTQSTELVKGDTNQRICINSTESQEIKDQSPNTDQSNQESVSNTNSLKNEEKEPKQSQDVEIELPPLDDEKKALEESQPIADSSDSVKPGPLDKEEELSNINEETKEETRKGDGEGLIHTEKLNESGKLKDEVSPTDDDVKIEDNVTEENIQITAKSIDHETEKGNSNGDSNNEEPTGHVLSTQPEARDDIIAKAKSDFEEKQKTLEEDTLALPKQDEFNVETATGNGSMSNECDPNSEKDQLVSAEEKSELAYDEKETVLASSIPAKKIKETNQLPKDEEAEETNSVHTDHKEVPSEELVKSDKTNSLSQSQEAVLQKNSPTDGEKPSEQPIQVPVTQSNESNEPESSNTVELEQEQSHSQQEEYPVYDDKSKDGMEENTVNKSNEEIYNVEIPSDNQPEEATEHPLPESSCNEKILEKGDSLQEIKEEYADLEKQELKVTKESESSEKEGEGQEEQHENLQLECNDFDNPQLESSELTCDNVRNGDVLNENDNSATDENLNTTTLSSTNSDGQAAIKESDQTDTLGWGEAPVKKEAGWGGAIGWNQEPAKDLKKDESEGSTKYGEGKGWSNQDDSQTASNKQTNASWNQEIVQDNKLDGSNEWSQVPVQQWGEYNWNQNQNSNNAKSNGPKIQSPKAEAKKPSPGSWRDQIASAPKDDNVGGWKQFATDQAAHNVIKGTRIESPKPKKAFLPKSVRNSPKLEKSWVGDSTSWSKKSDVTQATSTSSIQSDTPQTDSPLLPTNQQSWSKSPIVSHSNTSWSNKSTSVLEPSDMSQKEPSTTTSSSPSASNPWAEFSALEKERSARSQTQSKQSQSQAPSQVQPQPQLQHEATQTTPLQTSTEPPVISISLSDFDSVQLEHKNVERPNAPIEINMTWNGGDIIIDSPAENSTIMHVPLVVSLDDEPQELSVTPKLEHATLAANPTHSNHSIGWNTAHGSRPELITEHHTNLQNMPMDGS